MTIPKSWLNPKADRAESDEIARLLAKETGTLTPEEERKFYSFIANNISGFVGKNRKNTSAGQKTKIERPQKPL